MVTNTTYKAAPWADVLYAMDRKWWEVHLEDVRKSFVGERVSRAKLLHRFGVTHLETFKHYNNSGAAAISLAAHRGASTVILLGYDCQYTDGKRHWHGDHPRGLGNAGSVAKWVRGFEELASAMEKAGVRVLNASRETALTCWERVGLDDALADG